MAHIKPQSQIPDLAKDESPKKNPNLSPISDNNHVQTPAVVPIPNSNLHLTKDSSQIPNPLNPIYDFQDKTFHDKNPVQTVPYLNLEQAIALIDEPNRLHCYSFLSKHQETLSIAWGSKSNHQNWSGGYLDHVVETMNIANVLYTSFNPLRPLQFNLSDALLVLFLHDLEKPWKYDFSSGKPVFKSEMQDRGYIKQFTKQLIKSANFVLTSEHVNAMEFVEGEIGVYSPGKRSMLPLAAFCHICDIWSARGWYDQPKVRGKW